MERTLTVIGTSSVVGARQNPARNRMPDPSLSPNQRRRPFRSMFIAALLLAHLPAAVGAIKRCYGTRYTGGNVYDAIYPAAGSSMDWAYGVLNVKYSFCYELRPSGYSFWTGFRLPASQIIPTGQETTDSLMEIIKAAAFIEGYKL